MGDNKQANIATEITPYRMGCLMDLANKVTKQMISGAWHLTYNEMELILKIIQYGIDESREQNKAVKMEE
jgi:hypothetical protein